MSGSRLTAVYTSWEEGLTHVSVKDLTGSVLASWTTCSLLELLDSSNTPQKQPQIIHR